MAELKFQGWKQEGKAFSHIWLALVLGVAWWLYSIFGAQVWEAIKEPEQLSAVGAMTPTSSPDPTWIGHALFAATLLLTYLAFRKQYFARERAEEATTQARINEAAALGRAVSAEAIAGRAEHELQDNRATLHQIRRDQYYREQRLTEVKAALGQFAGQARKLEIRWNGQQYHASGKADPTLENDLVAWDDALTLCSEKYLHDGKTAYLDDLRLYDKLDPEDGFEEYRANCVIARLRRLYEVIDALKESDLKVAVADEPSSIPQEERGPE